MATLTASPSTQSLIIGIVQYEDGQPVAGAQVAAQSNSGSAGRLPIAISDRKRRFRLRVWHPGTYRLYASKESEMYLDSSWAIFATGLDAAPEVVVVDGQTVDVGLIPLGPKGARVNGCVVDASSGGAVSNATVIVRAVRSPDFYFSTGANIENEPGCFSVLVPPGRVYFDVSASGYETWHYSPDHDTKLGDALDLQAGTILDQVVRLRPAMAP